MNLRGKVLRGGAYLVAREGLGIIIGLVGVVLVTRAIGPANFGLYILAQGIAGYLGHLATLGVPVYLVRRQIEPGLMVYHQAFTLLLVTAGAGLLLGLAALPLFRWWLQDQAFMQPLLVLLLSVPLTVLAGPAMARLERDLNYRAVAIIELVGQSIYYMIAVILAFQGRGVWAPVTGYLVWQFFTFIGAWSLAQMVPRPCWSGSLVREITRYSASFSVAQWVWQMRALVNPLVVGRFVGPEAVGYVALAIRLVDVLSFAKGAAWRLSLVAFAKLQGDYRRLKRALEEMTVWQILMIGPLLALFAGPAPWLLPLFFGTRWSPVLSVYPLIALGSLVNALFSMHTSALYVLRRNWDVALFHAVHIVLFAGAALLLVPRWGLWGYGWAEVVAFLSYGIVHIRIKPFFSPDYRGALPWLAVFCFPLLATMVSMPWGLLLWLPLLLVSAVPECRRTVARYLKIKGMRDY